MRAGAMAYLIRLLHRFADKERRSPACRPNRGCDEHDQQRLMIGPAKLRPLNENRTDRVQDLRCPPIPEFHSARPPPEEPAAEERKRRRNKCTRKIERVQRKR